MRYVETIALRIVSLKITILCVVHCLCSCFFSLIYDYIRWGEGKPAHSFSIIGELFERNHLIGRKSLVDTCRHLRP